MSDKLAGGIKAGSVDVSIPFVLRKTTDNTEQTGKVATDMTGSYWRQGGTRTAITLSDLAAVNSAHSDGGVKEVDATNTPGLYRLDLPDAAVATGADWVVVAIKVAATYLFFERYALETVGAAEVKTQTAAIETDTQDIQSRLPAALTGGRMDSSVGAVANGAIGAAAFAAGAIDAAAIADNAIDAAAIATGAITSAKFAAGAINAAAIADGAIDNATFAANAIDGTVFANGTITSAKFAAGALTLTLFAQDFFDYLTDDVWDEALSGHLTAGTAGAALNAAGAAADPWATALPGAYGAGTAGFIIGTNLNATVSSRATQTSVDTIDDFLDTEIAAIKAKTDQLVFTNANKVDAAVLNAADFAQAAADKVWSTAARTLTSFGTLIADIWAGVTQGFFAKFFTQDSGQTYATSVAGSVVKEIVDNAGGSTPAAIADAVWDELISGHLGAGSTGAALNAAGSAGDPWTTPLPGAYGAGTAGFIIGTNINATISSRATQTSVDTIDDFLDTEIAAIKAKTDQLAFTNANKVDAAILGAADFAQAAADKVWATAARTLTSFGTLTTDVATAVWAAGTRTLTSFGTLATDVWAAATRTLTDKTGFSLSATGLNSVGAPADLASDAAGRASFVGMIRAIFNRFYNEVNQTATQQTVKNDGGTVHSTMAVSDNGTTQTKGKSS